MCQGRVLATRTCELRQDLEVLGQAAHGAALQLNSSPIDGVSIEDGLSQILNPLFIRSHDAIPGALCWTQGRFYMPERV
jgi:hypothetical protein